MQSNYIKDPVRDYLSMKLGPFIQQDKLNMDWWDSI